MTIVTVVETPEFQRRAHAIMSNDERLGLIDFIARNPGAGVSIGSGIRKVRFARDGGGKSGGYRVIHFYCEDDAVPIFLITVFAKNEKDNLSKGERNVLAKVARALRDTYGD